MEIIELIGGIVNLCGCTLDLLAAFSWVGAGGAGVQVGQKIKQRRAVRRAAAESHAADAQTGAPSQRPEPASAPSEPTEHAAPASAPQVGAATPDSGQEKLADQAVRKSLSVFIVVITVASLLTGLAIWKWTR